MISRERNMDLIPRKKEPGHKRLTAENALFNAHSFYSFAKFFWVNKLLRS